MYTELPWQAYNGVLLENLDKNLTFSWIEIFIKIWMYFFALKL